MAAVWLLCFDDVYLAAGVTSYMLARSSVRHLLRSYAPHVQICWSTKLSTYTYNDLAGSSNAALLDKRGQRILRHVISAVVVVGDTPSDASVAHRRLTKIWHTRCFYLYLYQFFFVAPGYQFKDFHFDDSISKLSLSSTAFEMFASAFTINSASQVAGITQKCIHYVSQVAGMTQKCIHSASQVPGMTQK